jgi:hypothetical protein
MRINDTTSISVFTSGRDDDHPYIGLRLESTADGKLDVSTPPFTLEQAERLIEEIQVAQAYVKEFEAKRGKPRAMSAR